MALSHGDDFIYAEETPICGWRAWRKRHEAEGEALRQLESELGETRPLEELPAIPDKDDLDGSVKDPVEILVATPIRPSGETPEVRPLFSEEQIHALDAAQQRAPHLYGGARRLQGLADALPLPRPAFLTEEEKRLPLADGVSSEAHGGSGRQGGGLLGGVAAQSGGLPGAGR